MLTACNACRCSKHVGHLLPDVQTGKQQTPQLWSYRAYGLACYAVLVYVCPYTLSALHSVSASPVLMMALDMHNAGFPVQEGSEAPAHTAAEEGRG